MKITIELEEEMINEVILSLNIRKNIIETSDPLLSAKDVENYTQEYRDKMGYKINALHRNQMRLLLKLDDITDQLYNIERK